MVISCLEEDYNAYFLPTENGISPFDNDAYIEREGHFEMEFSTATYKFKIEENK
jgi:hypothetical protein